MAEQSNLTPKQERFCREYVIDLNGTQAAIRAGYAENSANEQSSQLLAKLNIQQYISQLQEKVANKLEINQEWVARRFKEISDRCMQAEPVMIPDGNGGYVESGEYKFDSAGANKATEMLGKHLGFFERDNSQKSDKIIVKIKP